MRRISILLIAVALIAGMVGCNGGGTTFYGGSGTEGDPYQIANWHHLHNVRNYLDNHFILVNNLDSTTAGYTERASPTANQGKGWQPIGTSDDPFTGSFDGLGYEISGMFINRPDEDGVGLLGAVVEGVIENVKVLDADVIGDYEEGTLGDLNGDGIIMGLNKGTVSNSYSSGSVSGSNGVGGLVGTNGGTVSNSYSSASVTGSYNYVGGLVGVNYYGTVSNSYSIGSVTGNSSVGGLVGLTNQGTVNNSFWDTETSGQNVSAGGTGKNTTEMKDIDTFLGAIWNITNVANPSIRNLAYIWNIVDDVTYPFLSWQP